MNLEENNLQAPLLGEKEKQIKNRRIMIAIVVVVALLCFGLIIYFIGSESEPSTTKQEGTEQNTQIGSESDPSTTGQEGTKQSTQQNMTELGRIFASLDFDKRKELPEYGLFQKCNITNDWGWYEILYVPVPLQKIEIHSSLYSTLLTSYISQTYVNIEKVPVEIQYVFPVDVESVIYNLTIRTTDNITIIAQVMETTKAKEVYEQAIKDGNTAYQAQYDSDKAQDKVVLMIGNLQPGVNVTVTFTVATQVKPTSKGD